MLFLTGSIPKSPELQAQLRERGVGVMAQPRSYAPEAINGWPWAADNGCFNAKWDPTQWIDWLQRMRSVPGCLFAVVPDKVGDAAATRLMFSEWAPLVADLGFPLAYVAQDGATCASIPWDDIAAVFIGGSTTWKLSHHAEAICRHAKRLGLWVHVGRVNSLKRMRIVESWGADSCDGTFLRFAPDTNVPRLTRMLDHVEANPSLFGATT